MSTEFVILLIIIIIIILLLLLLLIIIIIIMGHIDRRPHQMPANNYHISLPCIGTSNTSIGSAQAGLQHKHFVYKYIGLYIKYGRPIGHIVTVLSRCITCSTKSHLHASGEQVKNINLFGPTREISAN